ncbi:MAG: acyl-CoA dehydrogenase [Betaproteobacteria bacterium]|nr:MAG: acyl-CoA dehydrogenase [Betaproteobacteria bacterium]
METASSTVRQWIGRTETASDTVTATPYAALSATLDHWLYFLPLHRLSDVGPDGHTKRGGFLPPVPLPRRMWAGSQFEFVLPLRVGDAITRTSTIADVTEKSGRSGSLIFVKVRHDVQKNAGGIALTEFHDIVYRGAPAPGDPAPKPQAAPSASTWERKVVPSDVLLFRYSALTFNSHRIHYDRRYVTEVEGYPGLVVHGPLIATLLLDLLRRELPDAFVAAYQFKAIRPLFDLNHFFVCGERRDEKTVRLWARDHEGWLAMDATAVVR